VNANGSGNYFPTRAEAVRFVLTLQSQGIRVIDVGCFQVNLFHHPAAFATLEEAFEPVANADYAARFLTELHAQTRNWPSAVARYHSGQAVEGEGYRLKVMSRLRTSGGLIETTAQPTNTGGVHRPAEIDTLSSCQPLRGRSRSSGP
jgi:hypothetical protein